MRALLLSALAIGSVLPAAAQEDVERRTFTFLRDDLVIDVVADGPGTMRLVRAGRGAIEVAGRAGGAVLGLGPPDRPGDPLRLTALGRGRVDWLVTVPAHVRVQVRTPGEDHVRSVTAADIQTWRWRGSASARPAAERRTRHDAAPSTAFTDRTAPDTLTIDSLVAVERLIVRIEGDRFGIAGTGRMTIQREGAGRIDVAPRAGRPIDVMVVLPANVPPPVILAAGQPLLTRRGADIDTPCRPVSLVRTATGQILTFTPDHGVLRCGR